MISAGSSARRRGETCGRCRLLLPGADRGGARGLEVIEGAEDVVVPSGRKRKTHKQRLDDFASAMGEEPVRQKKFPAAALRQSYVPRITSTVQFVKSQALEHTDGGMNRSVGRAIRAAAIPAAVGHLLFQEMCCNGVQPAVFILEVREHGNNHPGYEVSLRRVHLAQAP